MAESFGVRHCCPDDAKQRDLPAKLKEILRRARAVSKILLKEAGWCLEREPLGAMKFSSRLTMDKPIRGKLYEIGVEARGRRFRLAG